MKNRQWNQDFPDVPDSVHQTVLDTLTGLDEPGKKAASSAPKSVHITGIQKGVKTAGIRGCTTEFAGVKRPEILSDQVHRRMPAELKMKRTKTRTMIILAAALVIVLGTTVAAAELFHWNEKATDIFVAEPELQDRLNRENISQEGHQSVTDNGLTITAIQTIQDSNCFYALFEVTAEDTSILIDENCGMDYLIDFQGGEDPFTARSWGFVSRLRQEPGNSRYFEIFGTKMEESSADLNMNIRFTALTGPGEKALSGDALIEGSWDFGLTIHSTAPVHIDLNREYQIAGYPVLVKSVELSPLTCKLVCGDGNIGALFEKEGSDPDQADDLRATYVTGVKYQDGTVIDQNNHNMLWEHYAAGQDYEKVIRFDQVIEPEKVTAFLLGEQKDEIAFR